MSVKILCTLGPVSLNKTIIKKLDMRDVSLFRINLSHTTLEDLESTIKIIQKHSNTPICLDTEGAQVRNLFMEKKTFYETGQLVKISVDDKLGNNQELSIRPREALDQLNEGSIITIDFGGVMMIVSKKRKKYVEAKVINSGHVSDNKAITFFPFAVLPALSDKDKLAINIAKKYGITTFALSFTNSLHDVKYLRKLVGKESKIISKIETIKGVENLASIIKEVDAILIDRGDLSREVPLENIPFLQKKIINKTRQSNKPVYVATNLLESMLTNKNPTRAEISDVVNTLIDGVNGLVLAAETAIGKNPIESVDILRTLIKCFQYSIDGYSISDLIKPNSILLPNFHGTESSNPSFITNNKLTDDDISKLPSLNIDIEEAMDAQQILSGAYSPLEGFMNEENLYSVLDNYTLCDNTPWTLPILLQRKKDQNKLLSPGRTIVLVDSKSKAKIALLHIKESYSIDLNKIAKKYFGTNDKKHPGVNKFVKKGNVIVAGKLEKLDEVKYKNHNSLILSPSNTRMIFTMKGWSNVIGFHTRNIPHRGHEFIMKEALKNTNADGLFIHPVIGPKKTGDFKSNVILETYDVLRKEKFNKNGLLAGFPTYSRYAGPREAVFTAICRKNYGCRYFIIGRDHTGVSTFYKNQNVEDILNKIGGIGVNIIYFNEIVYNRKTKQYLELNNKSNDYELLKGTDVRELLLSKKILPKWLVSDSVSNALRNINIDELFV